MSDLTLKLGRGAVAFGLAACLAGMPALAAAAGAAADPNARPSRPQNGGFASGVIVGAVTGGPLGAMVGGVAGAWLGNRYHQHQLGEAALATDLADSETRRTQLTARVAELDGALAQARSHGAQLDATVQQADQLGLDVGFRTDDDAVTVQTMAPLLKLGALVASVPQARLRLTGFTDPRGSVAYNEQLSLRRAHSVAEVLAAAGVPAERILIEAHGKADSAAAEGDLDAYALERRVTVRVELPAAAQVARRD
jgi:outer membrane protein OmpA-like peptidoglycan-associated protein